jgi:hypothetical protein
MKLCSLILIVCCISPILKKGTFNFTYVTQFTVNRDSIKSEIILIMLQLVYFRLKFLLLSNGLGNIRDGRLGNIRDGRLKCMLQVVVHSTALLCLLP